MSDVLAASAGVPPMHPKASSAAAANAAAAAAAAAASSPALTPTAADAAAAGSSPASASPPVSATSGTGLGVRGLDSPHSSRASASASASRASSASSSVSSSPSTAYGSLAAPHAEGNANGRSPALSSRARPFPQSYTHTATPVAPAAASAAGGADPSGDSSETATSAARNDSMSRNLQQLALQNSGAKSEQLHTSFSPGIGRRSVKIAASTFLKPSPGFRTRTLSKGNESAALFPKFHYLPSLGLGVGANIDNNSKATSAFAGADQQYHFIDSPLLTAQQKLGGGVGVGGAGPPPEHSVATAGGGRWIHPVMGVGGNGNGGVSGVSGGSVNGNGGPPQSDNDSPGSSTPTPSSTSASPGSVTHTLQTQAQRSSASAASGTPLVGTGSPLTGSSPGVGVRRLAEQFLNSITDDSPAVRPRRIGLGKHATIVTPSAHVPTLPTELKRDKAAATSGAASTAVPAGEEAAGREAPAKEGMEGSKTPDPTSSSSSAAASSDAAGADASSSTSPSPSASSSEEWAQLHADILKFSDSCAADSARQKRLREELVQRTQWSIRCVWPTAHVDLVGSVAAGVCLPKSDLDFVVRFPPSASPPPSYSYATAAQSNAQGVAPGQAAYTYTAPIDPATVQTEADGASGSPPPSVQHFAQASTLIKLIGGRKKSKLLFRSTKIQVFKDINLIRLRDGCSGISMDLWFPVDPAMLTRSQQHTLLIHKMLSDFPHSFYPLAIVLKSFMAQNLLNSGYSGLGSYGVLLMLIRFLQYERSNAQRDGRAEESNLGKLLVGFFRLYATFDYIHHAIDVVNIPDDGGFIDKPDVLIVARVRKPTATGSAGSGAGKRHKKSGGGEDSDEDDDLDHAGGHGHPDDDESGGEDSHAASVVVGAGAGGSGLGSRESASLKKKRSNAADRFTLLIRDPMDAQNQIICHHKALRNMIGAFIRAILILDPDRPAPPLMLPPTPVVAAGSAADEQGVGGVDGVTPALSAVGPGVDPATASAPPSIPGTPVLVAQPMQSLPSFPGLAATANLPDASRFHRLIEVNAARLGPQTKPCLSAQCLNPDGTSQTMCPIQNKVCFTCGHPFVKANGGPASSGGASAPNSKSGPKHASSAPNVPGGNNNGGGGGQTVRHLSITTQVLNQHRSPPMQGQHQRNYLGRPTNHQQQQQQQQPHQQASPQPMQTQQQMFNTQQALLAAQQLLSQQLSQAASAQPLMYFNMQTQQLEMMAAPSSHAPISFVPVMGYTPTVAFGAPPQQAQLMYGAMQGGGSGMEGQVAAQVQLQSLMASLQQQQQLSAVAAAAAAQAAASQQQQQYNSAMQQYALMAQGAQQMQPAMYVGAQGSTGGGGGGVAPDLSGYMGGQPYGVNPTLSYDGLSPLYTTRTISEPLQAMQHQSELATPPSPPTRLRSSHSQAGRHANGAPKPSSRANRSNNFQQQQQQQQQTYYTPQQQQQQQAQQSYPY